MKLNKTHLILLAFVSGLLVLVLVFVGYSRVYSFFVAQKTAIVATYRQITNEPVKFDTDRAKILLVGDVMMGRYVRTLIDRTDKNYPFAKLPEDFFDGYDMVIANLEGPISERFITGGTSMVFGFPPDTAQILKDQGITAVTLGNNHTLNRGERGVEETHKYLQEQGVEYYGKQAGESWEDSVLQKNINNLKVTFISLHDAERDIDEDVARSLVVQAAKDSDYVVVQPHWGIEYQHKANARQVRLAHDWIDNGADIIVGHHPHVVQNMEIYNGKAIFYSLGNFIFDQYFSTDTQQELAINVELSRSKLRFKLLPLKSARSQSSLMTDEEKTDFLSKFIDWSQLPKDGDLAQEIIKGEFTLSKNI